MGRIADTLLRTSILYPCLLDNYLIAPSNDALTALQTNTSNYIQTHRMRYKTSHSSPVICLTDD